MTQALVCNRRMDCGPSRSLVILANTTAAYPLFVFAALYTQWLLSWWVLGHQPRPSLDDPKDIDGASWMSSVTALAFVNAVPALCAAAVLNTLHFLRQPDPGLRISLRILGIVALWLGVLLLLRSDPGHVVSWWLD